MEMLETKNLVKYFDGLPAVDGFSFSVEPGKITALVGPNGAGKTTVFNLITGFIEPDKGEIFARTNNKKHKITKLPPHKIARLGIARTFQKIRLFSQITVLENLLLATKHRSQEELWTSLLKPKKVAKIEKKNYERALHYLEFVGLIEKRDELAENLSHGQRKLLSLARALCLEPEILLLDEPTAGMFPKTRKKIVGFLNKLRSQKNTILFIEHDMHFVVDIADKIVVMNEGKKLCEGTPREVIENPIVIEAYLGKKLN